MGSLFQDAGQDSGNYGNRFQNVEESKPTQNAFRRQCGLNKLTIARITSFHLEWSGEERELTSKNWVMPNESGEQHHTAWYINDKGIKVWLKFDPSRPCTKFSTTETRFYKPKLHKQLPDFY